MLMTKRRKGKPSRPRGRPTVRTQALEDAILGWLMDGRSLSDFCQQTGKPDRRTVNRWKLEDAAFLSRINAAKAIGCHAMGDDILAIADTPVEGQRIEEQQIEGENGEKLIQRKVHREDMLGHRKLRIEARWRLMQKWAPKEYGNKVDVAVEGKVTLEQLVLGSMALPKETPP
jgi:hypothetical protein